MRIAELTAYAPCSPSGVLALDANPLMDEGVIERAVEDGSRTVVAWSGSLAPSPFAPDPSSWNGQARAAFDELCRRVEPALERAGATLLFRPHARQALSDIPSCRSFVVAIRDRPFGLALDAAAMIEESMAPEAPDHLRRIFESLGAGASGVVFSGAAAFGSLAPPAELQWLDLIVSLRRAHASCAPALLDGVTLSSAAAERLRRLLDSAS